MRLGRSFILVRLLAMLFASGSILGATPAAATQASPAGPATEQPTRSDDQPFHLIRASSELQEQIVGGNRDALTRQSEVTRDISRKLAVFDLHVWTQARNRTGLIKFVLNGGDLDVLQIVLSKNIFPEPEKALAQGVLQYALGRKAAAIEILKPLDIRAIGPSLAGHIALIKAILARDGDAKAARHYSNEARLLSPGSAIEEAALRLSIDLAIAQGDAPRLDLAALRYAYRFPQSLYRTSIDLRVARVLGARNPARQADDHALAMTLAAQLADGERVGFLMELAEAALRSGHLATAESMAKLGTQSSAPSAMTASALRAFEGAAMLFGPHRGSALQVLSQADTADAPPAIRKLIIEARKLAVMIEQPPPPMPRGVMVDALSAGSELSLDPKTPAAHAHGGRARQKDEAVLHASQRATQQLDAVDAILERAGQ